MLTTELTRFDSNSIPGDLTNVPGFSPVTRKMNAQRIARVAEAAKFWVDVRRTGDVDLLREAFRPTREYAWRELCSRYPNLFTESMTTSDFPSLTADVLDKVLLGRFQSFSPTWKILAKVRRDIRDFRSVKLYEMNGGAGVWVKTEELEGFERRSVTQAEKSYAVAKYTAGFALSWEDLINDDLGIFADLPTRLADGGNDTIEKFVTQLYVDANGPHASFFTGGNGNILSSNPVLSLASLGTAIQTLMGFTDSDGRPIQITKLYLVVGSGSLYVTAMNLKNQLSAELTQAGGTANQIIKVNNWLPSKFEVVHNPWIPIVASTANGSTTWFVFADPGSVPRPALHVGFLRGFDSPVLFQKAPNAMRVGGGLDPTVGDFEVMGTEYKGVLVFGGARGEPKAAVSSNGSGS